MLNDRPKRKKYNISVDMILNLQNNCETAVVGVFIILCLNKALFKKVRFSSCEPPTDAKQRKKRKQLH